MMRKTVILAAAFAVAACGKSPAPETPEAEVKGVITSEALEGHVAWLADDAREGRMAGQPGYDAAAQYVADRFEEFGLEPGGEDGGWYQQVPLVSYRADENSITMVAHRDGQDKAFEYKEDFTMGGDKVRESTHVRAEVVYVGFGVHAPEHGYSDYDGIDVEGKLVAAFGNAPGILPTTERAYYSSGRTKSQEAIKRGAVGFVGLVSKRAEEYFPWERVKANAGVRPGMAWISITGEAADYFPELEGGAYINVDVARELFAGTPISFDEARAATEESRPASTPLGFELTLARNTSIEQITSPNVVGIVRGTDPELADEYVVYSAHLDHNGFGPEVDGDRIYNGAYDNAMGVSLMLEAGLSRQTRRVARCCWLRLPRKREVCSAPTTSRITRRCRPSRWLPTSTSTCRCSCTRWRTSLPSARSTRRSRALCVRPSRQKASS